MTAEAPAGHQNRGAALVALVIGACAMGASPIFVRLTDVGPFASAFWRTALALPFLLLWMRVAERAAPEKPATAPGPSGPLPDRAGRRASWAVVVAGLCFAGDLFFWHLAIFATTVANATFFATTAPVWVALVAWLLASEHVGARTLAGLGLCIAGGVALAGQSLAHVPGNLVGDLYGVITAVFFGLYILALRSARPRFGAARLTFLSTAVTAVCLFAIAALFDSAFLPNSLAGVMALLALALVSQVAGQGLLAVALGSLPATFSSTVIFIEAIAAAAFAWAILGEALGPLQAAGGAFILAGIWLARPRAPAPATPGRS